MPNEPENSSQPLIRNVTGVILAGGKSSRFGRNKAFIQVQGIPLIERVLRVMASVFERRLIVTNTPEEYGYLGLPMVQDLIKGIGSLGGIYTGLATISDDAGFFVACDMPYLNEGLLRYLVSLREGHDAVVPRINRMVEPLHAVYAKPSIGTLKELIESGQRQILELFSRIDVRYVEEETIRSFEPDLRCFANLNSPEDLAGIEATPGDQDQARPKWPRKIL
jgi:molybdenum cofactor guanylyltransferase